MVLFFTHILLMVNHNQRNTTGKVATLAYNVMTAYLINW